MGWSTLARYAAWAALIIAFFGAIGWALKTLHSHVREGGATSERIIWEEREIQKANANARETSRLTEEAAALRAKFMGSMKNAENQRIKLVGNIIDLRMDGLFIAADCGSGSANGAGEGADPSLNGGGSTRIKLPEKITADILGMTQDAQVCVIKYDLLRAKMKSLPNIEIVQD